MLVAFGVTTFILWRRIGSFTALGFSLIGVGWLYGRYLPDAQCAALTDESYPSDISHVGLQG